MYSYLIVFQKRLIFQSAVVMEVEDDLDASRVVVATTAATKSRFQIRCVTITRLLQLEVRG